MDADAPFSLAELTDRLLNPSEDHTLPADYNIGLVRYQFFRVVSKSAQVVSASRRIWSRALARRYVQFGNPLTYYMHLLTRAF